ncbi:hypothetical protein [uncultured Corynebacterium sp.]|uniref:hypothetical protein n=1 Tax=uncultured Corynebacterium sp. TaxID=159447 RepID=UPI0025CF0F92|nr:hypothetical protein [uncultured Corynebacterium sp.]
MTVKGPNGVIDVVTITVGKQPAANEPGLTDGSTGTAGSVPGVFLFLRNPTKLTKPTPQPHQLDKRETIGTAMFQPQSYFRPLNAGFFSQLLPSPMAWKNLSPRTANVQVKV